MTNLFKNWNWKAPDHWSAIRTIDLHTGGEPLRVFIDGLPEIPGDTILKKRRYFRDNLDFIRTGTMWEPRGHADMYGAVVTDPTTPDGDFGTFFLHNEGYSTMCGHAMIALVTLMLDTGIIKHNEKDPIIRIDAPPGRITAKAKMNNGKVQEVRFLNVPSFVLLLDKKVDVPGIGKIRFDVAFGGAFYAFVEAKQLGFSLERHEYYQLIEAGRRIKEAVARSFPITHPLEEDLSFLYGTIFTGMPKDPDHHSRNVCIFADGEVDRSPTGSGISARAALHFVKNELKQDQEIYIESILGSLMSVRIDQIVNYHGLQAIIPEVSGTASITGRNEFYFDPEDPFREGFIFR